ncbi:hypothetical protein EYC84_004339 [Monilinia fructicola]|uniref:G-patch domain-containing protein n=1 Tax=Monilinia fructicola TaxID=38448 RepID=A0A5M9K0S7_MONFR|nr:hypothetical protein EYC84_004339 [Monilinia fructicola]
MNAHALLTSQGWRGTGHSLHHSSDTIGLSRPLLVSKKDNVLGVGKKQHKTSDMWWMNAFDASLKGLDTSKEGQIKVQEGGGLEMVVKGGSKWVGGKGGLYSFFVRGETVGGTIEDKKKAVVDIIVGEEKGEKGKGKGKEKKRKGEERRESKEERRARKEKKRADRARKAAAADATEMKEERRERKERKRQKKLLRQSEKESSDTSSTSEVTKDKKKKSRKDK